MPKRYPKVLALRPWYKWIGKSAIGGRFSNRRKVACFFGFVPREYSTGTTQRLGSITKVGSARLRAKSIELVWRLIRFQPNYGPILHWRQSLCSSNKALKKKAVVAVARRMVIDIWRMRTPG